MLQEIMTAAGLECFGVADYKDTQPGPDFKRDQLPQNPRSVVVCLLPWDTGHTERNVARYAVGRDYHAVAKKRLEVAAEILRRLFPEERFVTFCDGSPVAEVRAAVAAGLGVRGLNNLLISDRYGTRCAIGEIVSTLAFPKSQKRLGTCLGCLRCLKECPGRALSERGFDRSRCVSRLSQKKGTLTPAEEALVRKTGLAWGCDRCTDCCPMNRGKDGGALPEFLESAVPFAELGMELSDRAYGWRGAAVLERNLKIWQSAPPPDPQAELKKRRQSLYEELGGCNA